MRPRDFYSTSYAVIASIPRGLLNSWRAGGLYQYEQELDAREAELDAREAYLNEKEEWINGHYPYALEIIARGKQVKEQEQKLLEQEAVLKRDQAELELRNKKLEKLLDNLEETQNELNERSSQLDIRESVLEESNSKAILELQIELLNIQSKIEETRVKHNQELLTSYLEIAAKGQEITRLDIEAKKLTSFIGNVGRLISQIKNLKACIGSLRKERAQLLIMLEQQQRPTIINNNYSYDASYHHHDSSTHYNDNTGGLRRIDNRSVFFQFPYAQDESLSTEDLHLQDEDESDANAQKFFS